MKEVKCYVCGSKIEDIENSSVKLGYNTDKIICAECMNEDWIYYDKQADDWYLIP